MTDYDPETDFSQFRSYYLADSILFIGQDKILQYLDKSWTPVTITCRNGVTVVQQARRRPTWDYTSTYHLWDTPLHLIGGGDFPVIGVLFIGRTEFGGRNRLVGGKFQKRTPIHNEIQRAAWKTEEFGNMVIRSLPNGEVLRLKMWQPLSWVHKTMLSTDR